MPIQGVDQPELLPIDQDLRLRRFDGSFAFALPWYQDVETLRLVDGKDTPYDLARLERMYRYLNERGELYWIELRQGRTFLPIGDVTFWQTDMPIVVGEKQLRGMGIGKRVVTALLQRGRQLGCRELFIDCIYFDNLASVRLFESCGFVPYKANEKGCSYRCTL